MTNNEYIIKPTETILITGAGGFVGSKVFETLLNSYGLKKLRCLVRTSRNLSKLEQLASEANADVEFLQGNLLSRDDCKQAVKDVSVIYHLAVGVGKSFPDCFLNSVVTTRNLLDFAILEPTLKRFVNTSSIAVYTNENIPRGGVLDETCPTDTKFMERAEAYAYGKAKQDELVLEYADKYKLPYVIVRPSVIFGPGKVKISDRIGTDIFGVFLHLGLSNIIPMTYIDNCADAIALAGLRPGIDCEVFNITDDNLPTSRRFLRQYKNQVKNIISIPVPYWLWYAFNALWEKYSKWSEGQLPPVFNRRSCEFYWKRIRYSNKKTKEMLKWQPRVPMDKALEIFFQYMKSAKEKKK
jgi:nucleoside-diphosphate-sugar epimerase